MLEFDTQKKIINKFTDDYKMLSNFEPCIVHFEGRNYPTTEHAYQAAKSKDEMYRLKISKLPADKAGKAKRLGRKVKLRENWELLKLSIMKQLLIQKFRLDEFKQLLISTGDAVIIEGNNWHDNYWGDCYCPKCKDIQGKNMLGTQLMKVRRIVDDQPGGSI